MAEQPFCLLDKSQEGCACCSSHSGPLPPLPCLEGATDYCLGHSKSQLAHTVLFIASAQCQDLFLVLKLWICKWDFYEDLCVILCFSWKLLPLPFPGDAMRVYQKTDTPTSFPILKKNKDQEKLSRRQKRNTLKKQVGVKRGLEKRKRGCDTAGARALLQAGLQSTAVWWDPSLQQTPMLAGLPASTRAALLVLPIFLCLPLPSCSRTAGLAPGWAWLCLCCHLSARWKPAWAAAPPELSHWC